MNRKHSEQKDFLGLVTLGFFLLLVGAIFAVTPNLSDRIYDFFKDLKFQEVYSDVYFPTPRSDHPVLYNAVFQFCLAFAIFQLLVLGARFVLKESIDRKAGTFSSLLFWFGAAWTVNLLMSKAFGWFAFLGWLVTLAGISLVVKSVITLVAEAF